MLIPISYPLNRDSPLYPGTEPVTITRVKSIARGDDEEKSVISFSSHAGTHIDLPGHFCKGRGRVSDLLAPESVFEPALCIEVPKEGDEPLRIADLLPHLADIRDAKALFIRTGNAGLRGINPDVYAAAHPWVHHEVPGFLRMENPDLRLFGIDTISIGTPSHPDEGIECHRRFLCESPHIFLLEDVDLSYGRLLENPWILRVYPMLFDDLDGVPVIALAEVG
jgi:arylformamidase